MSAGTGTLTAQDTTVELYTEGMSSVIMNVTGTWVGTIVSEGQLEEGNWLSIVSTDASQSVFSSASVNGRFVIACGNRSKIRLRMSAYTSGTANVSWAATEGIGAPLNVWNTNATSLKVAPRSDVINNTGSAGSLNADIVASIDVGGYQTMEIQITGTFVGTVTFQGSEDNSNFVSVSASNVSNTLAVPVTNTTTTGSFYIPLTSRYFRARMTSYTSGTASGAWTFDTMPSGDLQARNVQVTDGVDTLLITGSGEALVAQPTAANLNAQVVGNSASAASDSGNPVKIATKYNSTNPTFTDGQRADVQSNQFGHLSIQFRTLFSRTTGNTTTTAKSGSGTLHGVIIGNNGTGGVGTIYDNTTGSGTVIMHLNFGSPSGGLLSTSGYPSPIFLGPLGIEFATGLTLVTTGSSSNDITLVYR